MNCADAVACLSAAVDGELAPGDDAGVRQHLDVCEACARRYRTLQQVRAAVRATPFAAVDAARFDARVVERVGHNMAPTRVSASWLAAAAALVIAVSSAVLMLQEHSGITPTGQSPAMAPIDLTDRPGFNAGLTPLAIDCGTAGAATCVVEREATTGLTAGN